MAEFFDAVPADDVPGETASVVEVNGKEVALVHCSFSLMVAATAANAG